MKDIMKPIEVIAHFDTSSKITPYRFRYEVNDREKIVIIDSVITRHENTFSGNSVYLFDCITQKNNKEIRFQIKENKWFISKF